MEKTTEKQIDPKSLAQKCWVGIPGRSMDRETKAVLKEFTPDGVVLFKRNVSSDKSQIISLIDSLQNLSIDSTGKKMNIAIDQEGGTVKRLPEPFGQYPDAISYGPNGRDAVYKWGVEQGKELYELGITMDFAPVADVNDYGPDGIMARRAFGTDPHVVASLVNAAINGLRDAGVQSCAKHFPGIGYSTLDSHFELPVIAKTIDQLEECELIPFKAAIENKVDAIMIGHLVYPALDKELPASLSKIIMVDLLKKKMGFKGLIISDDMDMGAVTKGMKPAKAAYESILAGADRVLICQKFESYIDLVIGRF